MKGANQVLEMAEELVDDAVKCAALCSVILEEMDDLSGYCDNLIEVETVSAGAVEVLKEATENIDEDCSDEQVEKIFDLILGSIRKISPNGITDWQGDLLYLCIPMCRLPRLREKFEDYLHSMQEKDKYIKEEARQILCDIIERFDGKEALEAYKRQIAEEEKKTAYKLIIDGDFKSFPKLKKMYSAIEWEKVLDDLLNDLQNNGKKDMYINILIHEDKKEGILR